MALYLDPKADLTFKKVFGEHKDLLISFLNAMLPLEGSKTVSDIEYLPPELVPETPLNKDTIVDVRCTDQLGRTFIVEMQMIWTQIFMQRVLFNTSKSYSRQLDKGGDYADLQPVYSLNLINDVFRSDTPDCYHDYGLVDMKYNDQVIEGIHLIFIELPKFKSHSFADRKMAVLWLRFLTEINEKTRTAPKELLENPETKKALDIVRESAYTPAQMDGYDHFWDMVSVERTLVSSAKRSRQEGFTQGHKEGLAQGKAEGKAEGMAQGMAQGKAEGKVEIAQKLLALQVPIDTIINATGLTGEEIAQLK